MSCNSIREILKEYAEVRKSEESLAGWDILDILQEDVPFDGTLCVPTVHPGTSGCSSYLSMEQASLKGVRRANIFLLGKSRSQALVDRDEKIHSLTKALEAAAVRERKQSEELAGLQTRLSGQARDIEGYLTRLRTEAKELSLYKAQCVEACRQLGEKAWLDLVASTRPQKQEG